MSRAALYSLCKNVDAGAAFIGDVEVLCVERGVGAGLLDAADRADRAGLLGVLDGDRGCAGTGALEGCHGDGAVGGDADIHGRTVGFEIAYHKGAWA